MFSGAAGVAASSKKIMNLGPASSAAAAAKMIYGKEEKPKGTFSCPECDFKSQYRFSRDRHLSLIHGIAYPLTTMGEYEAEKIKAEKIGKVEKKPMVVDKSSQTSDVGLYGLIEKKKEGNVALLKVSEKKIIPTKPEPPVESAEAEPEKLVMAEEDLSEDMEEFSDDEVQEEVENEESPIVTDDREEQRESAEETKEAPPATTGRVDQQHEAAKEAPMSTEEQEGTGETKEECEKKCIRLETDTVVLYANDVMIFCR